MSEKQEAIEKTKLDEHFATESREVDPSTDWGRADIVTKLSDAMDAHVIAQRNEPFRSHLGASVMGSECDRYLWYHFRWFKKAIHSARMLRLFNTGFNYEPRIRAELVAIGCKFLDTVDVDGKQISVSALAGHAGGSCDGVFIAPQYGLTVPTLLEGKTSGTGAGFNELATKRVAKAKPMHFIQQSIYGRLLGIKFCLYVVTNKNDDDRYLELVELDWQLADEQIERARRVIVSPDPPERISNNPAFFICKMCTAHKVCHGGEVPIPNCRNCKNATPVEDAQWHCGHWNQIIPKEHLIKGCPMHEALPR